MSAHSRSLFMHHPTRPRRPLTPARLLVVYISVLVTYSLARIPIGVLVLVAAKGRHPDTIAWAMRTTDQIVYFPYHLVTSESATRFERTDLFAVLVIGYFGTAILLALLLGIRAVFRRFRDLLEALLG